MIGWLAPAALAGLALLAVPILIHLLRPERAERVAFPSLRFVQPSWTAAVRFRTPSDALLLFVRLSIVSLAVLAAAQPVLVTESRTNNWNQRVARALVVDTSLSMATLTTAVASAIEAAPSGATFTRRFEHPILREGIARAVAWLESTPPAQCEVVVFSDFQIGSLQSADIRDVPAAIGLRFVRLGEPRERQRVDGARLLGPAGTVRTQELELSGRQTGVALVAQKAPVAGLRIVGAAPAEVDALIRIATTAGALAPAEPEPVVIQFAGGDARLENPVAALEDGLSNWMWRAVLRLKEDDELTTTARESTGGRVPESNRSIPLAWNARGEPMMQAAAAGRELLIQIGAAPDSLFSAVAVRAVLAARHGSTARPEQEILTIDPRHIESWVRAPGAIDAEAWRRAERSDGRWLWGGVLSLLIVEQFMRRASRRVREVDVAAA